MKNNGFKFGNRNILGVFLALLALLMGACSEKDSVDEVQPPTMGPVKFSIDITSPQLESSMIGYPAEGDDWDIDFYSHFNEGASKQVFVKQNGKMYDLGDFKVVRSESDNSVGVVSVDAKDVVTAGQPYDVYIVGGSYRYDNNGVYFRRNLTRKGGFDSWLKFSSSSIPKKADDKIDGTVEILYVINKSGAPIKFKHKGFDVANRWYYTYGEVSIDSGTVTEYENGKEVEGEVREVPVFTGEDITSICSYYVPSGNKISNAQLIAEIDGKEVRSENRISSDLTIQLYHSYAMFAVWDGEKLRMGDENGEAVVHVCSDDENSDFKVVELKDDGTVVLSGTSSVPKVGEILVSGITEAAPYGFLYKVKSVSEQNGKIVVKTEEAYLNELLQHAHVEERLQLREVGQDNSPSRTNSSMNNAPSRADWCHIKKKIPFNDEDQGDKFTVNGIEVNSYVKGTVDIDFSIGGTFIWDADGIIPDRAGVSVDGELSLKVVIEAATKVKYEKKFYGTPLEPIVLMIAGFPVIIVPYIDYKCGIKTEGKVYVKWKAIDIDGAKFDAHVIWNKEADMYGENWDLGANAESDFDDLTAEGMFQDMLNCEAGLDGEAKFSVWPELTFKLYNSEHVSFAAGFSPFGKLSGDLALKWAHSAADDPLDEFELKDNISISLGADIPLSGKLEFNAFGKKIGGEKETSLELVDWPLVQGATLVPAFNNFVIYPEENAKSRDYVHVSATRGGTIAGFFEDYEEDYGFCMAQVKKDKNGKELPKDWTLYSMKSKYSSMYGLFPQYNIEMDIPTFDLLSNATYEIRAYTILNVLSTPYSFWRKGGKFKTGGDASDGGSVIIDVPGEEL